MILDSDDDSGRGVREHVRDIAKLENAFCFKRQVGRFSHREWYRELVVSFFVRTPLSRLEKYYV